jgi:hypothetical protein
MDMAQKTTGVKKNKTQNNMCWTPLKIALSSPTNSLFIGHASNPPYPY